MTGGLGLAAVLALALWVGQPADGEVAGEVGVGAAAEPGSPAAGSSAAPYGPTAAAPASPALPATAPPAPVSATPPVATRSIVPIIVTVPRKLLVGEMNDLVVGVGANADVGEIGFTVQFDADVLQVRAGIEGDWAAGNGLAAHFMAEISDAEDRMQIRSAVSGGPAGMSGGSVAIVQFQAIAPGTTSVIISDLVVKDLAGRPVAAAASASNLQVTVEAAAPP